MGLYPKLPKRRPRRDFTFSDPPMKNRSYSWSTISIGSGNATSPTGPTHVQWQVPQLLTRVQTRFGNRLANWREIIARGENATTNMTARSDSIWYSFGSCLARGFYKLDPRYTFLETGSGALAVNNGQLNRVPKPPVKPVSSTDSQAAVKFYKALRKEAVQVSGPTFIGELGEAWHMIRRPAGALYGHARDYTRAVQKAKRASPHGWREKLGGLWLEYSFGWVPLISDLEDGAKAWMRLGNVPRVRKLSRGFENYYDRSLELDPVYDHGTRLYCGMDHLRVHSEAILKETVSVRYKGALKAQAEMTQWDNWALFGFTPSEFIPTAWELLPWSFLVDYFTNIGDILTSAVTDTRNVIYVNKTVRQTTEYSGKLSVDPKSLANAMGPDWDTSMGGNPGMFELKRKDVTRSASTGITFPRLEFSLGLSDGQLGNIAALLAQARLIHPQSPRKLSKWFNTIPVRQ